MEAFESWLDKKSYSQAEERIAEEVWVAALKWALLTGSWERVTYSIRAELYKTDAKT